MGNPRFILKVCDDFPPVLCRILARKGRGTRPMSTREIADVSGLSSSAVDKISKLTTWRTVGVGTMQRFSLACGVNLLATSRQKEFLRRRALVYMQKTTKTQRAMYARLQEILCSRGKGVRPETVQR